MDPAQLSDSANLLWSATGVLTPVSQVLTIAVDKDSDEVETLPQAETQIEVFQVSEFSCFHAVDR